MIDTDVLRPLLTSTPFRPFRLVASNGEAFVVERSQDAFLTHSENLMFGYDVDPESGLPKKGAMLSLAQIVSVEPVGDAAPPREPGFEGDPFTTPGED